MPQTFGEYFKACRKRTGKTLRVFCEEHGFDPVYVSKVERGRAMLSLFDPLFTEYAGALGIEPFSDEWAEFNDLATEARYTGEFYPVGEQELLAELPHSAAIPRGLDAYDLVGLVRVVDGPA